jgi:undecaprenyl-diphosphatase
VLLVAAALGFALTLPIAVHRPVPQWELDWSETINDAPDFLEYILWPIMQLGTFWAPIIVGIVAGFVWNRRRGVAVIAAGLAAWLLAKVVKDIVERGRPLEYIPDINVREGSGTGLGFISGHTATAFAIATALLPVLPRWGRIIAYLLAAVVGLARIVWGVHLPFDTLGGACAGIMCGAIVELVMTVIPTRTRTAVP